MSPLGFGKKASGGQVNPAEQVKQLMKKWNEGEEACKKATLPALEKQLRETSGGHLVIVHAAFEIGRRGNIEFLTSLIHGSVSQAAASVDGLCCAGCNGNDAAIEAANGAIDHPSASVRLLLIQDLAMIADGTPGDSGFSTTSGRQSARTIIKTAAGDSDPQVRKWVAHALEKTESVRDIRRGADDMTFVGRRLADTVLESINPNYGRL